MWELHIIELKMKILIVNGYSSDYNGQKRFDEFLTIIKDVKDKPPSYLTSTLDLLKDEIVNGLHARDDYP